ncbi:MAG: IS5 family transposase [Azonexus sp.]
MKQISFATLAESGKKRKTKRERFLEEMETVVPWLALVALIEPHYPKAGKGRRPRGLETMLRIYFMQQWFNLSDPGMEDALYDVPCMRAFARLDLFDESMPDETIHAPPSTKNEAKQRDPEMRQTKKGNQWYFGMKIHVGADVNSGLAHTVAVTAANEADVSQLPNLLREDDRAVFGDKGYVDNSLKRAARKAGVFWGVALKSTTQHKLTEANKRFNRKMSSVRSRVEHLFRVIKRQFGYTKVRYKGLAKNAAQVFTLIGLTNLYLARRAMLT